jgi:hypothetical protein
VGTVASIGVDVGQRVDPSAIVVCEAETRQRDDHLEEVVYNARMIEAIELGTPYAQVARRVAAVVAGVRARPLSMTPRLCVDITGLGRPVFESIRAELEALHIYPGDCRLVGVTFTYGQKFETDGWEATLGKAYLVSRLQVLLQTDRLHLPRTAEAEALAKELLGYEIKVDEDGDAKFGAFKVGAHDDLVTALGLAVLYEETGHGQPVIPDHPTRMYSSPSPDGRRQFGPHSRLPLNYRPSWPW